MKIETIVSAINNGYNILEDNSFEALSIWINVWDYIKTLKQGNIIKYFVDLEKITDEDIYFFDGWIQDFELELSRNNKNKEFINKRLDLCKTILEIYPEEYMDIFIKEKIKMAMVECYYLLVNREKAVELFEKWLSDDPSWGIGWINWTECYLLEKDKDNKKVAEIFEQALKVEKMHDKDILLERAIDFYNQIGNVEKAKQCEEEFIAIYNEQHVFDENYNMPRRVVKIGRNEPCPCGSGKKYKKCCGG